MSNELDIVNLAAGEIAPYQEGMPILAPIQPDSWGTTDVDLLREDQHRQFGSSPTLFGTSLPADTSPQQVQAALGQISGIYLSDMSSLNYPNHLIQSTLQFFMDNATRTPQQVRANHPFRLPSDLTGDWLAVLFANHLHGQSGTQQQKQQFLNATLAWLNKLSTHVNGSHEPAQGRAPQTASFEDSLSDAEWAELDRRNEVLKANTENTLRRRWGSAYEMNVQVAQEYLNGLPARERQHLSQITNQGIMLNTVQALTFLFDSAIGKASIPTSGGGVNQEIQQIEQLMKTNPKAYFRDNQLQGRLRELYNIRDKR